KARASRWPSSTTSGIPTRPTRVRRTPCCGSFRDVTGTRRRATAVWRQSLKRRCFMAASNGNTPFEQLEMRDAFGQTLVALGEDYPNMIVLDADLHTSSKAGYFKKAYPNRFIQVG